MKKLLMGLVLALATIPAVADWVSVQKDGTWVVAVAATPCPAQTLELIRQTGIPELVWRRAVYHDGTKETLGCWARPQPGTIILQWDDGDRGIANENSFRVLKDA